MGDGGVACMPIQHSIMDRLSATDKTICNNGKNVFSSNSLKLAESEPKKKKMKKKVKKVVTNRKGETVKSEVALEKKVSSSKEIENGEICSDKTQSDEVEEGELGTLKWPTKDVENGELDSEKSRSEKEEITPERWGKGEKEKEEYTSVKSRKGEVEREDRASDRVKRCEAVERGEFRSWRGSNEELEKGEFIPERWHRDDSAKDDFSFSKSGKHETARDRGWKNEFESTPPSMKYSGDDMSWRRGDFSRSSKNRYNLESSQERGMRLNSKTVDDVLQRDDPSNDKNQRRDFFPGNYCLKRYDADSDSSDRDHDRKSYGDYTDHTNSKSRRLTDDGMRFAHSEQLNSRHSVERPHRNSSSSTVVSAEKYSSRNHESSFTSRGAYDRSIRSPVHSERVPRDRSRQYDHRDRSPLRCDRSPYNRDRSPYNRDRSPCNRNRSPYNRNRSPYNRDRSPYNRDRSPYNRNRSPYNRDRSSYYHRRASYGRDRSPHDCSFQPDRRNKCPAFAEQSPQDRGKSYDRREQTQTKRERSPHDRVRPHDKETSSEKLNSLVRTTADEEKPKLINSSAKETQDSVKESEDRTTGHDLIILSAVEEGGDEEGQKDDQSQSPQVVAIATEFTHSVAPAEELGSMEEDMDICDTPPHVPVVLEFTAGRWVYLDYNGIDCGPSKLYDIKKLVEEGHLCSDHFIRHLDSDRWVTVDNAASPMVTLNFSSILPDSITQLVSPPEAPGNMLKDIVDGSQLGRMTTEETPITSVSEPLGRFCIDNRVEALLERLKIIPGEELEIVGEALEMTFDHEEWDKWGSVEGFILHRAYAVDQCKEVTYRYSGTNPIELRELPKSVKDFPTVIDDTNDWFPGHWACKGGDWKRNEEPVQDRLARKKLVLNDGFPLCQMPKSGYEDPRWQHKDELYHSSYSKRLALPSWAFSCPDEKSDSEGVGKPQIKTPLIRGVIRGVKGTVLPVVRINGCVVMDHGFFISESRSKSRGKDRDSLRSSRKYSSSDLRRSSVESDSRAKMVDENQSRVSRKSVAIINIPKDRVCAVDELQLHWGDWYYLDGAGCEHGPQSFSDLRALVDRATIPNNSSVFRKFDGLWVPVTSSGQTSEAAAKVPRGNNLSSASSSGAPDLNARFPVEGKEIALFFHSIHPQFIGYTRGKLHGLVMRSYKRELAAIMNEVVDPWLNAKQPKREIENHIFRKSDAYLHASKRARRSIEESEVGEVMHWEEPLFEDLYSDPSGAREETESSENLAESWALLDHHLLARIFHFLRSDLRSLAFASSSCRYWRDVVSFYKNVSRQVNLSSMGPRCSDPVIWSIMDRYNKDKIGSLILTGCSNITSGVVEELLHSFPNLSHIDISGCGQFGDLVISFSNVNWVKSQRDFGNVNKIKSLKQLSVKYSSYSPSKEVGNDADDFSELKDYFASVDRRDAADQAFRHGFYQRTKLFDARKSSSIVSRDARVRRIALKNAGKGYKRMEEFLVSSMKEIMKENTFDLFVPKVAEIERRIRIGYYIRRGISSIKEDISRMCRDAIKAKTRDETGDMNHMITLFIQLATRLEERSKSSFQIGSSTSSKYKKKHSRVENERRHVRSDGSFGNCLLDDGEYGTTDWEIKRRLSKLNRRSLNSESETSDEFDYSVEGSRSDSETTASGTESDVEPKATDSRGDLAEEEAVDSFANDREWGARMTKASLVPPVTRKYEVIDSYVIVADEEHVRTKMKVSLPDDYAERLDAQKNGAEDLDMELPEVKDFKPRKQLGDEVIEQEVYGIDPYTHNLLLDSMPEELEWTLLDKHLFIEDMLLRTLNKQVRHFTDAGNTPMVYSLQPVVEEIERTAEDNHDAQMLKMCQGILRAIESRREDKYVAYRKGLGVVCNKEGGFVEEDFVVEFLGEVYPTWKWFEKQDGIRSLQKNSKEAPEFYNIYLERPKGDADGYDLVVVDAMHKANYASRICHSCRPNCEAKVTAVDGQYQIGIYSVRKIHYGEEVTFDYNSVTESKEEYEASVCLCGSQVCRGSYLNLTGEGAFQKVLEEWHGILDRHQLLIEACEMNAVSEDDYYDLGRAGLSSCLLGGLPDWLVAYSARLVRFINFERTKLPNEFLKHNLEEKRKYFLDICLDVEKSDAEVQAEGVYNQRLQNLAITLDKVRYVMRNVFGDPKSAPPPLERLSPTDVTSFLWSGEGSVIDELLQYIGPHMDDSTLNGLKSKIHDHNPSESDDIQRAIKKSLLWLRDELRNLPCGQKCRHDAAADLIHVYAYTKSFFKIREYKSVTSPPVFISPLDLGTKFKDQLGDGGHEYCKTYGGNYCLGQLMFWYEQTNTEPDTTLFRLSRGCLSLPDVGSFYTKVQKSSRERIYGSRTVRFMLTRMEKQPQRRWPKDRIWMFKSIPKIVGTPMLDSVLKNTPLDKEMVQWLKNRPSVYQSVWDQ